MKAFITGSGFIDSSLADQLLIQGQEVVGLNNFSTGEKSFSEKHPTVHLSARSSSLTAKKESETQPPSNPA
jgi:nucleoside-diphosphate-sugar epimerase